jgi:hypothetical protein
MPDAAWSVAAFRAACSKPASLVSANNQLGGLRNALIIGPLLIPCCDTRAICVASQMHPFSRSAPISVLATDTVPATRRTKAIKVATLDFRQE